ncbi:MAG TPA: iron ABC transporter permease [Candidatus Enteromonas pullicola]|uniref:Iron ABC transporter permease n=1 Tax=Candidatus Alloenteromonas pullicola TaxID=2840784 RepID=A0A9D1S3E6_9FIRM|nr:iron ABC transporter permease [Candidatus Enteromonas pullicola]
MDVARDDILAKRQTRIRNRLILALAMAIVVLAFALLSLLVDTHGLSWADEFLAIFGQGSYEANIVVGNIRGRRVAAAIIVGFGLSVSGAVMQSSLKNPMASPSTLGVSEAATFGATLAILFLQSGSLGNGAISISNPYAVTSIAFVFSLISIMAVLALSKIRKFSPEVVALSGVALGMMFQAGTNMVQYFASDTALTSAVYWTFGDLGRATYSQDWIMLAAVGASTIVFFFLSRSLNALEEGDDTASALGVRAGAVRFVCLALASLVTAVSVSFVGIIGFIGLVIPQVVRRIFGSDSRFMLLFSGLVGSASLLICDLASRVIMPGTNLPVGAITAIIGAPIFIYILLTNGRRAK